MRSIAGLPSLSGTVFQAPPYRPGGPSRGEAPIGSPGRGHEPAVPEVHQQIPALGLDSSGASALAAFRSAEVARQQRRVHGHRVVGGDARGESRRVENDRRVDDDRFGRLVHEQTPTPVATDYKISRARARTDDDAAAGCDGRQRGLQ